MFHVCKVTQKWESETCAISKLHLPGEEQLDIEMFESLRAVISFEAFLKEDIEF